MNIFPLILGSSIEPKNPFGNSSPGQKASWPSDYELYIGRGHKVLYRFIDGVGVPGRYRVVSGIGSVSKVQKS